MLIFRGVHWSNPPLGLDRQGRAVKRRQERDAVGTGGSRGVLR